MFDIVNIKNVPDMKRIGTGEDSVLMERTFKELGFYVQKVEDPTAREMTDTLMKGTITCFNQSSDHKTFALCACVHAFTYNIMRDTVFLSTCILTGINEVSQDNVK